MDVFISWLFNNKEWLFSGLGLMIIAWIGRLFYKQPQTTSSQHIRSGDSSTNVQAGRDVNIGTKKKRHDVG